MEHDFLLQQSNPILIQKDGIIMKLIKSPAATSFSNATQSGSNIDTWFSHIQNHTSSIIHNNQSMITCKMPKVHWYPMRTRQRIVSLSTMLRLKDTKLRTFSKMKNRGLENRNLCSNLSDYPPPFSFVTVQLRIVKSNACDGLETSQTLVMGTEWLS